MRKYFIHEGGYEGGRISVELLESIEFKPGEFVYHVNDEYSGTFWTTDLEWEDVKEGPHLPPKAASLSGMLQTIYGEHIAEYIKPLPNLRFLSEQTSNKELQ